MPSRRRPITSLAASLPVSRLPLGTPQVSPRSPPGTNTLTHFPHSRRSDNSNSGSDKAPTSDLSQAPENSCTNLDMASKGPTDPFPAKSIAETKLERQKKRNEEAEAALTGAAQHKKRASRAKGKQWKPFDFNADVTHPTPINEGVPLSQDARVGTFRGATGVSLSRGSSQSRPVSSLSHRSSELGPADMDRQDSFLPGGGFQVAKGRRNRKIGGEITTYQDSHEGRQKTVEASYDEREIYEVFGNALPGPEFMEQHLGQVNGQLQFVQHPNGDISAHQWSSDRYIWENIGQFSNIRKKVEGQLAADRLKGETAYQTLQQHTLAYFRIIAKQREANVTGVPFGAKEIQAAIPEPQSEIQTAAPTGLKEEAKDGTRLKSTQPPSEAQGAKKSEGDRTEGAFDLFSKSVALPPYFAPNAPNNPAPLNFNTFGQTINHGMYGGRQDDPFFSANTYRQIYGGNPYMHPYYNYNQPPKPAMPSPFFEMGQQQQQQHQYQHNQPSGLNYDFSFPQAEAASSKTNAADSQISYAQRTAVPNATGQQWPRVQGTQVTSSGTPGYPQYTTTGAGPQNLTGDTSDNQAANDIARPASRLTPGGRRTPMGAELWKISNSAKERSLSQANIRTVLYDPFQTASANADDRGEADTKSTASTVVPGAPGFGGQAPSVLNPASARFFPAIPALQINRSTSAAPTDLTNLRDSSPDHPNQKWPVQQSTMMSAAPAPDFGVSTNNLDLLRKAEEDEAALRKAYDEECTNWFFSGNKFARQQDFFDSVMKLDTNLSPRTITKPQPSFTNDHSAESASPECNTTTTRLLIPVLDTLMDYVHDRVAGRRDYFCPWTTAPEWAIDKSERGNESFFDDDEQWGSPPARVGRDPRYSGNKPSWPSEQFGQGVSPRFGMSGSRRGSGPGAPGDAIGGGIERRFGVGYVGQRLR